MNERPEEAQFLGDMFARVQAISDVCTATFERACVDVGVYVESTLFSCVRPDEETLGVYFAREIQATVMKELSRDNFAVYRARLSTPNCPYAWCGMELELEDCGYFDVAQYDEILERVTNEFSREDTVLMQADDFIDGENLSDG